MSTQRDDNIFVGDRSYLDIAPTLARYPPKTAVDAFLRIG